MDALEHIVGIGLVLFLAHAMRSIYRDAISDDTKTPRRLPRG